MSNQQSIAPTGDISSSQRPGAYTRGDYSGNNGSNNNINSGNVHHYYGDLDSSPSDAQVLQCFYTSKYQPHMRRVREPAKGTCTWVTEHPQYKEWLGKKTTGLLWLSADPGCGKSVIASFLVQHLKLRTNATVCYFFFKDDNEEQRNAEFALCAVIHQLLVQRRPICKYAKEAFEARGKKLTEEVEALWEILVKVVAEGSGDVICVVDALDECEERSRAQLIRHMTRLPESQPSGPSLKFLVTSRPYYEIETELGTPATTIRLRGEDEVNSISADVARVIDEGIQNLESYWGRPGELGYLRTLLESSADRTFLWVSLMLEILRNNVCDPWGTPTNLASTAPRDLPELYTKILNKSRNPDAARQILHIVVAAARPLTLKEINVAFRIKRGHDAIHDLGDLPPANETALKDLCGLFVRVIDSKVYLVHKSARKFLIQGTSPGLGDWQYTLSPADSNFILADICITYLSLQDFESDPLPLDTPGSARWQSTSDYGQKYALLDYAASHWADHFRDSQNRQMELLESTRRICERGSNRFLTWLKVYWENSGTYHPFPNDFTHLMIASWLGQRIVVEQLLKEGGDANTRSATYGTALNVAALAGNGDIAKTLIKKGVKAYIRGKEYDISLMLRGEFVRSATSLDSDSDSWSMVSRSSTMTWATARASMDSMRSWWTARSNMSVESWSIMNGGAYPDMDYEVIVFLLPYCNDLRILPARLINSLR